MPTLLILTLTHPQTNGRYRIYFLPCFAVDRKSRCPMPIIFIHQISSNMAPVGTSFVKAKCHIHKENWDESITYMYIVFHLLGQYVKWFFVSKVSMLRFWTFIPYLKMPKLHHQELQQKFLIHIWIWSQLLGKKMLPHENTTKSGIKMVHN